MNDSRDLTVLLRSRIPLLIIESRAEARTAEVLEGISARLQLPFFTWSVTEGLHRREAGYHPQRHTAPPADLLAHIKSAGHPGIYLLLDFHPYLDEPRHVRLLREIAQQASERRQTLVLLSPQIRIPTELVHLAARFEAKPPGADEVANIVREEAAAWTRLQGRNVRVDRTALELLTRALGGLSASESRRLARQAIADDGAITASDLPAVNRAKHGLLDAEGILHLEMDTARFSEIGGLKSLKRWLAQRRRIFCGEHVLPGLAPPRGILLLGVQGGGKSMAAKAVAGAWQLPLLRCDFGALYNKYIGETERNLRRALQVAETMAPCVLWFDEIEKGLAGDSEDGGTSRRVLGTLLTWMAERDSAVFLVATANDVSLLPPELLRKGRFDEIFFVDLPDAATRREIFAIHLERRSLAPADFDLNALAAASDGFSGAEIEQAVVAGLYSALEHNCGLNEDLLVAELRRTRPLSVVMSEKVSALRTWAAARTVPAN